MHAVLVIDDDAPLRYGLARFLAARGFEAIEDVTADAALGRLRGGFQPCAIVTDIVMPGLDGWGLIAALRADAALANIPVVMISGRPDYVARALALGVRSYLPKPVEPEVIADAVERHCRRRDH